MGLNNPPDVSALALEATAEDIRDVTDNLPNDGALTDISDVTDAIPDSGAMTSIAQESTLEDVQDEVEETEQHIHNVERWWGAAAVPTETNAIAATVTNHFQIVSGNNDWGTAIPICGTADNPVLPSQTEFDAHRVQIIDLDDQTDLWRLRIIWGTGTSAAAIAANQWTEVPVIASTVPGNRAGGTPVNVRMPPVDVGTKLWAQAWNDTNGETLQIQWGAHGYPYPP